MTIPVITLNPAETTIIDRAETLLGRVNADDYDWPASKQASDRILAARFWLTEALNVHDRLLNNRTHPADEFPELADGWPDDAMGAALELAAQHITDCTEALEEAAG